MLIRKRSVLRRIAASFAILIAVVMGCSGLTYSMLTGIDVQALTSRDNDAMGMLVAGRIRTRWAEHMVHTQQILLAAGSTDPASGSEARAANLDRLKSLEAQLHTAMTGYPATMSVDEDRQQYSRLSAIFKGYLEVHEKLRRVLRDGKTAEALRINAREVTPAWNDGRELLTRMIELNKNRSDSSVAGILNAFAATKLSLIATSLLSVIAAMVCAIFLLRGLTHPVRKIVLTLDALAAGDLSARMDLQRQDEFNAIEVGFNKMAEELKTLVGNAQRSAVQISTSITQIAATSRQQQASATESAASTTQIGATSRAIASTARELVRAMGEVSESAGQTSVLAGTGQHGLERMAAVMHQVLNAAEAVNGKLAILSEKAGNITQVVTTIVKVADQTNLLSLNASIEAEKAGEYGRGFGVVATEVRRLADQTAVATYDIEQMVREMQAAVSAGVMGMDKFSEEVRRSHAEVTSVGDQLTQIIHQVQKLSPQVQLVNDGMQAQATGAVQIKQALMLLSEAAGQTHESLQQTGASIDELNQVAGSLRTSVSRFKV